MIFGLEWIIRLEIIYHGIVGNDIPKKILEERFKEGGG